MKKTWLRALYDAGTALEIRGDRLILKLLWASLRRAAKKRRKK